MTISVAAHNLVTAGWKTQFFVGQLLLRVRLADSNNVDLYRFQNGDMRFLDNTRHRQFFAYGGGRP